MYKRQSRIRLGSAAVLLPFRPPIEVAEDVATIDILSNGRFDFGVARGGPFPEQNRHFGVLADESRPRMLEALQLVQRLLKEDCVSHEGRYFKADNIRLTPRPLQRPVPTWIASLSEDAIGDAAEHGFGVMAGLTSASDSITQMLRIYLDRNSAADPQLVVSRFYCSATTHEVAIAEAIPFLRQFFERRRRLTFGSTAELPPLNLDGFIERSLIGSHDEVRAKLDALGELNMRSLLLVPASEDARRRVALLEEFRANIR